MYRFKKHVALFFLVLLSSQYFGEMAFALTSGPEAPERAQFKEIGMADMVNLATGDFNYSIPLLDAGGYPITLSYSASATGIEDEATNVGLGWNIDVGSVNRSVRGVPDDFRGDQIVKKNKAKDDETFEVSPPLGTEILGLPFLEESLGFSVGWNSYWGYFGRSIINLETSHTFSNGGKLTSGISIQGSSNYGASISPNLSYTFSQELSQAEFRNLNVGLGTSYNTRAGLRSLDFTYSRIPNSGHANFSLSTRSSIDFFSTQYGLSYSWPRTTSSFGLDIKYGPEIFPFHLYFNFAGSYTKNSLNTESISFPAFGSMYSNQGKNQLNAIQDFGREKDFPFTEKSPNLPVPVISNDVFSINNHYGSSQFFIKSGSTGIFNDPSSKTNSNSFSVGFEIGSSGIANKGGLNGRVNVIETKSEKWKSYNDYKDNGDHFGNRVISDPNYESYFPKTVGINGVLDAQYFQKFGGENPVNLTLGSGGFYASKADSRFRNGNGFLNVSSPLKLNSRANRKDGILILTAEDAASYRVTGSSFFSYPEGEKSLAGCFSNRTAINRIGGIRKAHHISSIINTNASGQKFVYGVPVYVTSNEETTLAVAANSAANKNKLNRQGLTAISKTDFDLSKSSYGRDQMFYSERTPPHANSFLLTEILSPDYQDITGNGISDDDLGSAVKFNYTKKSDAYPYSTPAIPVNNTAGTNLLNDNGVNYFLSGLPFQFFYMGNYQEGTRTSIKDDKATLVAGTKEIWQVHSIESKNYYTYFTYSAAGVRTDNIGSTINWNKVEQGNSYLQKIELYSKEDIKANGLENAVPIKTVHFEYDYFSDSNLPNSKVANKSKLKLKKVWFTYGKNQRGRLNPYEFEYHDAGINYEYKLVDRWGNYKTHAQNPNGMNNNEFPYALQDKAVADENIKNWKLNKIKLPTGGEINIEYESDDYAYVQDKKAMNMHMISGLGSVGASSGLIDANHIYVQIPETITGATELERRNKFLKKYFEDQDYLFYRFNIQMTPQIPDSYEFVQGYAKVIKDQITVSGNQVKIPLEKISGINPIAYNSWSFMKNYLPEVAYPGKEINSRAIAGVLTALVKSFASFKELIQGFPKRAKALNYSNNVNLQKSFVRLQNGQFKKIGGGHRVKSITSNDGWANMNSGQNSLTQKMVYDYSMPYTNSLGEQVIGSSGVASYEPVVANEENPFRQPIILAERVPLTMVDFTVLERPFGESYYPGANIIYQQVKVTVLDATNTNNTGHTIHKFFTSKDFPTIATQTRLESRLGKSPLILNLLKLKSTRKFAASQGYSITTNDMAGKMKSVETFDKAGSLISGTYHEYKTKSQNGYNSLDNEVSVVDKTGNVSTGIVGLDFDFFTDMREEATNSYSGGAKFNFTNIGIFFNMSLINASVHAEENQFNSAASVKHINKCGILDRVITVQDGSRVEAKNLLWDAETGEVLLTSSNNEFDKPVYKFSYPAYWAYDQMGGASKNAGLIIQNFSINLSGIPNITNGLKHGDEVVILGNPFRYWVSKNKATGEVRLISEKGDLARLISGTLRVIQSGSKNMYQASVGSIVSLENPIKAGKIDVDASTKILDANAITYQDEWSTPVVGINTQVPCVSCGDGYVPLRSYFSWISDSTRCLATGIGAVSETISENPSNLMGVNPRSHPNITDINNVKIYDYLSLSGSAPFTTITNPTTLYQWKLWTRHNSVWFTNTNWSTTTRFITEFPVFVPEAGTYYFGTLFDNVGSIAINGSVIMNKNNYNTDNYLSFHMYPIYLTYGVNRIRVEARDLGAPGNTAFGIFKATKQELLNANSDLRVIPMITASGAFRGKSLGRYELNPSTATLRFNYCGYYSKNDDFSSELLNGYWAVRSNYESINNLQFPKSLAFNEADDEFKYLTCFDKREFITKGINDVPCFECITQENKVINPFLSGVSNNWKVNGSWVYKENRTLDLPNKTSPGINAPTDLVTNIRNSGYYLSFNPFWSSSMTPQSSAWVNNAAVTLHASSGAATESMDALGNFSAVQMGLRQQLPMATASNSRQDDFAFENFEERTVSPTYNCVNENNCYHFGDPFNLKSAISLSNNTASVTPNESHTGRYALQINGSLHLEIPLNKHQAQNSALPKFEQLSTTEIRTNVNTIDFGFSPRFFETNKYVVDFWVKDPSKLVNGQLPSVTLQIRSGFSSSTETNLIVSAIEWGPMIEGWRRARATFQVPLGNKNHGKMRVTLSSSGTVFIDDLRFFPDKAQVKSFVYDIKNLRLMSILDEEHYAMRYEYDSEGVLIRVKKETTKGIQTIQENRNGIRNAN